MTLLVNLIKILLLKIFGLFPDSPFPEYMDGMDTTFFVYLNWFFPLDTCLNMFLIWVNCVLIVLVLMLAKKYLLDKLLGLLMSLPLPF